MQKFWMAGIASWLLAPTIALGQPADLALTEVIPDAGTVMVIRHAGDGSGRLFIVDRYGRIRVKPAGSAMLATPFLNIGSGGTAPPFGLLLAGEGGFLGLAFHPNYENNRQFYVHYTDGNGDAVVARYLASLDPNVADAGSAQVVLRVDQDTAFHKGGDLHFGLDGLLYVSLGDGAGGNGADGCRRAQTLRPAQLVPNDANHADCPADTAFVTSGGNPSSRALMGKILRLDVDATTPAGANELCAAAASGAANYAIPAGNPFAGSAGTAGDCDEIWSYGLRNPFRISFDRTTGDLYLGDVGEGAMEEIDHQAAGAIGAINYGWPACEGTLGNCAGATAPILTYTHAQNAGPCASITGGVRYRGPIGGLVGIYVYADYCSGKIHFGTESGGTWSAALWQDGPDLQYAAFGEDEAGELYVGENGSGRVMRFTSAASGILFRDGFENP